MLRNQNTIIEENTKRKHKLNNGARMTKNKSFLEETSIQEFMNKRRDTTMTSSKNVIKKVFRNKTPFISNPYE